MGANNNIFLIVGLMLGISTVGMLALLIYYSATKKKYSKNTKLNQKDQIVVKNKSSLGDLLDRLYQVMYLIFAKIPIINHYTKKTRLKLEMVNDYTEYEIRKKTGALVFTSVLFIFAALYVFLNVVDDLYMALVVILMVFVINDVLVNSKVNKVADKIVRQLPEVFTEIRHSFHEHGMIEEAFNDAIDELEEQEITPQIKRIKEAILSDNPEVQMEKYYDTAPNKYLKLFCGLSYLTMELGDREIDGVSVYLKNLNNMLNDIYLEILKKDKLNYMFKSLTAITIAPIFFIKFIEGWAVKNFPSLINFYSSSIGFVIQAVLVASIFIAYFLLKTIKEDSNEIKFDRIATKRWQDKIYKWPVVRFIVDGFMPSPHTKKHQRISENIKTSNSYLTLQWFYVNKLTYAAVAFIATFALLVNIHIIDLKSIYNDISEEFISLGALSDADKALAEQTNEQDRIIVEKLKNNKVSGEELRASIEKELGHGATETDIDRILAKVEGVQDSYWKVWETLIALLVAVIVYFVPNGILLIKNKIRALEKEDEVMQFQSIILMLMYIERVDVQTVLEWLERYSYAYKEPISTALNNYEAGAIEALQDLKDAIPQKDFKRIVEALISAVERIPIRDAFDELETERAFQHERRKDANERIIQKKTSLGKTIGFTPLIILVAGYFVGPLLLVSILQLVNYMGAMSF